MKNKKFVLEWLKRAKSNLERAGAGKTRKAILYEDLCFDCQQASEKAIKALLISKDKEFPPSHSIEKLLMLVAEIGIEIPPEIKDAISLTDYAVKARYPGGMEPIPKKEFEEALVMSQTVYQWVVSLLKVR